ncbi:MAG: hypothetical protein R2701_02680 [Acidimicrobiales bacterium]
MTPGYRSDLHDTRVAAGLGVALGVTFTICFVTGVLSHLIQHPTSWFAWPARPAGLYRFTQGLHVATGTASIPLLVAKLWVVAPRFWQRPPVRDVGHAVERILLLPLVGGGSFLLVSGVLNTFKWYPWAFNFPVAHYWAAWIAIGGLVAHVGAKAAITWSSLRGREVEGELAGTAPAGERRRFLAGVGLGAGALTLRRWARRCDRCTEHRCSRHATPRSAPRASRSTAPLPPPASPPRRWRAGPSG